ncbi:MAG: DUF4340 domain-containing protein [Chitinispirillaceae bacterium]
MQNKKMILGLGVLVLVIAIFIVSEKLNSKKPSERDLKLFPGLEENKISSVMVREGDKAVKLEKKNGVWMVGKASEDQDSSATEKEAFYTADSASVQVALEKLVSMKKGDLISRNPEKQSEFGVDNSGGMLVEIWKGSDNSVGAVRIGEKGIEWNSNCVRLIGNDSVYSVLGGLRYSLYSELDKWREKRIVQFSRGSAEKISLIKKDGSSTVLEKSDSGWTITEPIQHMAAIDTVDKMLDVLSSLKTAEFVYDTPQDSVSGLSEPSLAVAVTLNGGAERKFIVGNEKEGKKQYWTRVEGKDEVFLISEGDLKKIDQDAEALKAEAMPAQEAPEQK